MKTVLLTGGHGFLGQYIRAALLANKHTVITLGRQSFNDLVADISADIELPVSAMNWVVHAAGKAHLVPH
ncbi:MAG TPA: NAD-dependent epimerase/dehydratase family protein, partial [Phnomibacter sp.]|nr:NAD-dependent epimerase/dehydratase family protein [Phnomibacter sp.]